MILSQYSTNSIFFPQYVTYTFAQVVSTYVNVTLYSHRRIQDFRNMGEVNLRKRHKPKLNLYRGRQGKVLIHWLVPSSKFSLLHTTYTNNYNLMNY